jgi:hypothetical protein
MNLLNEIQKPSRDNFSISSDANHGAIFLKSYFLTLFLIRCLLALQIRYSFYHTPMRIRFKDHSSVVEGAYSDEE